MMNETNIHSINQVGKKGRAANLLDNQKKYRELVNSLPQPVFETDIHGNITFVNQACFKTFGYTAADLENGLNALEVLAPEDRQRGATNIAQVLNGKEVEFKEYRAFRKDGSALTIQIRSVPRYADGKLIGLCGTIIDLTELKKAERKLRMSEEKFRALADQSLVGIAMVQAGKIEYINNALADICGYPKHEMQRWKVEDFNKVIHPDDADTVLGNIQKRFAGDKQLPSQYEFRVVSRSGEVKWIRIHSTLVMIGGKATITTSVVEISDRKKADVEIRQRTADLLLLNMLNNAINKGKSLEQIIRMASNGVRKILSSSVAGLYLLSEDSEYLVLNKSCLPPSLKNKLSQLIGKKLPPIKIKLSENPHVKDLLSNGRPLIINDPLLIERNVIAPTIAQKRLKNLAPTVRRLLDLQTSMQIPLIFGKKPVGLFETSRSASFTEQDLKRFSAIAEQLSVAIGRKILDDKLVKREQEYRLVVENANEAILVAQGDKLTFVNAQAEKMIGYSAQELTSRPFLEFVYHEDRKLVGERYSRRVRGEEVPHVYPFRIVRKDETVRWVEISAVVIKWKRKLATLNFLSDITERIASEKALRDSEALYHSLVESLPHMVFRKDQEGRFTFANKLFCKWLNKPIVEIVGRMDSELFSASLTEKFTRHDDRVIQTGTHIEDIVEYQKSNGEKIYMQVIKTPIYNSKNQVLGIQGILWDVTDKKRTNDQIKASLKEKEVLLKEIHHRVKNNLQIISSLLYLQSKNVDNEKVLELFKESQNRIKSMALIHEKLYRSDDFANIDFTEYIKSLSDYLMQTYRSPSTSVKLATHIEKVPFTIQTAIPCGLIINELISNSLKYAFPNTETGKIKISLSVTNGGLKDACHKGKCTLVVSDNGVGLPKNLDIKNTKSLGLQLVKNLTKQLNGELQFSNHSGTTFRITF